MSAGRLLDLIESRKLLTDSVKFFVLDEADRLLDSGNLEMVLKIFARLPKASIGTARLQVCTDPGKLKLRCWLQLLRGIFPFVR